MRYPEFIFFLLLIVELSSCSSVKLETRNGKDQQLTSSSFEKLNGTFSNLPADTNYLNRTLYCHFTNENKRKDSICSGVQYTVELLSTDSRSLTIALKTNETTVRKITLKGKYKEGYFKANRHISLHGLLGPLLWIFGENIIYIGLTNENNLIVINSGGAGALLIVAFPISISGGERRDTEYIRIK